MITPERYNELVEEALREIGWSPMDEMPDLSRFRESAEEFLRDIAPTEKWQMYLADAVEGVERMIVENEETPMRALVGTLNGIALLAFKLGRRVEQELLIEGTMEVRT